MIKRYKTLVLYSLLIPVIVILLVNLLYITIVRKQADDGRWIEEPMAKSWLLSSVPAPDYVFIGSSRTQNHIDSLILKRMGVNAVNLGVPGRQWSYYPYMVKRAKNINAQTIVISIPARVLYEPINCPDEYFYQLQLDELGTKGLDCFLIKSMTWDALLNELPMNRFRSTLKKIPSNTIVQERLQILNDVFDYRVNEDGRAINYIRGERERLVATYQNGDGQVFSNRAGNNRYRTVKRTIDWSHRPFNVDAVSYITALANLVLKSHTRLIYIIEPSDIGVTFIVDMERLNSLLPDNVRVINNADHNYPLDLWSDSGHFNLKGTKLYTQKLYIQLGTTGQNKSHGSRARKSTVTEHL